MSLDDSQMDKHITVANETPLEDRSAMKNKNLVSIDECKWTLHHKKSKKDMSSVIIQEGILIEDSQQFLFTPQQFIFYFIISVEIYAY